MRPEYGATADATVLAVSITAPVWNTPTRKNQSQGQSRDYQRLMCGLGPRAGNRVFSARLLVLRVVGRPIGLDT